MRLLSRVNERFAVDLLLRQVFDHPTVAGLAAAVVEAQLDAMPEEELAMLLDGLEMPMLDGERLGPLPLASIAPAIGEVA
jgi:hypothetical protein